MGGFKTCYFGLICPRVVNTFKSSFKQVCVDAIEVAGGGGIQRLSGIENPEYLNTTFVNI